MATLVLEVCFQSGLCALPMSGFLLLVAFLLLYLKSLFIAVLKYLPNITDAAVRIGREIREARKN